MRWVRYIAVHYWLHPRSAGVVPLDVNVGGEVVGPPRGDEGWRWMYVLVRGDKWLKDFYQ